jgi:enolase
LLLLSPNFTLLFPLDFSKKYLDDNDVAKKINAAINKMCKVRSSDPLGLLAKILQAEAKPPQITKLVGRESKLAAFLPFSSSFSLSLLFPLFLSTHIYFLQLSVLDSRGNPTVEVDVYCMVLGEEKLVARGSAPSGASTGSNEAKELRDGDEKRYLGKGTTKAVSNVNTILSEAVKGFDPRNLAKLDEALVYVLGDLVLSFLLTCFGGFSFLFASSS